MGMIRLTNELAKHHFDCYRAFCQHGSAMCPMRESAFGVKVSRSQVMHTYSVYLESQPSDDGWWIAQDLVGTTALAELDAFIKELSDARNALRKDLDGSVV